MPRPSFSQLCAAAAFAGVLAMPSARGQTGGAAPPMASVVPAPLALSPQESLAAFKVAPGFRVELVAAEPLVEAPVAITFDPQGRLWVVEMRDYMPDAGDHRSGGVTDTPRGRVVVLEDTDGDGRMDRRTVFLDNLTLPRAIALTRGGALVAEPPNLWLCPLPGAGGKALPKTALVPDFAAGGGQPEYLPNGLLRALDNWTYDAQSTVRYRFGAPDGKLLREPTVSRGQWGIAQDDWGRLFYNYNGDHLRGDVVPAEYLLRNPNLRDAAGVNVPISRDQTVFPVRPNRGVNRGYQPGVLRPDGTLRASTAACGPTIYRGELFPPEFRGNAFLCEPAGNLVRRDVLTEQPAGGWTVRNPYVNGEFLASTDERFRPVNLLTGPEGALYVVDMHRGIIQHTAYVTPYLREQIAARGLDKPINLGRIYRVVPEGAKVGGVPKLNAGSVAALVRELSGPNGTRRDMAQRLLVERGGEDAVPALRELATAGAEPLGRLHALWTLQGLGKLDAGVVGAALADAQPRLRAAAIRLSEPFLRTDPALAARVLGAVRDDAPEVQLQLALTLGQLAGPGTDAALAEVLERSVDNEFVRDGAISGLRGRELEFLEGLWRNAGWTGNAAGRAGLFGALARCVFQERQPARVRRLLDLAAAQAGGAAWRGTAVCDGLTALRSDQKTAALLALDAAPDGLIQLAARADGDRARERLARVALLFDWPGKTGVPAAVGTTPAGDAPAPSLPPAQLARFERGRVAFGQTCGACHQPDGQGLEGLAPPLADSSWVAGPEGRLVRIALHGVGGKLPVNGRTFQMEMPPMSALDDAQIAEILTYIRQRWGGQDAAPVEQAAVARVRAQTAGRTNAWTADELLKVP